MAVVNDSLSWKIRPATKQDVPSIVWLTQLLAEFEREPKAMKIGEKELLRDGFGDRPCFYVFLAELTNDSTSAVPSADPELPSTSMPHNDRIVGHALYFYTYSTWEGKCLYLEDLFVREEYRNHGIGSALMQECAKVACNEECGRMQWEVLDWNTRATDLYERIGAKILRELLTIRLTPPELGKFASGEVSIHNPKNI